jgi:hypothetical protein
MTGGSIPCPYPLDGKIAKPAISIHHVYLKNIEMYSMDHLSIAGGTKGRIEHMAGNIPDINVPQSIPLCDLISVFQG